MDNPEPVLYNLDGIACRFNDLVNIRVVKGIFGAKLPFLQAAGDPEIINAAGFQTLLVGNRNGHLMVGTDLCRPKGIVQPHLGKGNRPDGIIGLCSQGIKPN